MNAVVRYPFRVICRCLHGHYELLLVRGMDHEGGPWVWHAFGPAGATPCPAPDGVPCDTAGFFAQKWTDDGWEMLTEQESAQRLIHLHVREDPPGSGIRRFGPTVQLPRTSN